MRKGIQLRARSHGCRTANASTKAGGRQISLAVPDAHFCMNRVDIGMLSEILIQLIMDGNLRLETGLRMRERILSHFSIAEIKNKYVIAYRLLLDGKRDGIWDCSEYPPIRKGHETRAADSTTRNKNPIDLVCAYVDGNQAHAERRRHYGELAGNTRAADKGADTAFPGMRFMCQNINAAGA